MRQQICLEFVLGTIPAGGPVVSEEFVIDYFEMGTSMLKNLMELLH